MLKIVDLLKIPSLDKSYIVAGHNGILNTIKKLEVMEEPYPSVIEFLLPNGFLLTNFWSMKNNKNSRIQLVSSMIEARCAGLGIMPGPHLNNIIDEEIIELANQNDFPIVYISENVRWGDVISEYCVLVSSDMMPTLDSKLDDVLDIFLRFHSTRDINGFCKSISDMMKLPIIMCADTVYNSNFNHINVPLVVAKIQTLSQQNHNSICSPISIRIDENILAVVYFGERSIIATCIDPNLLNSNVLHLFHKIAPWIAKELDNQCSTLYYAQVSPAINDLADTKVFFILVKYEKFKDIEKELEHKYIVYEKNRFFNYYIILIPDQFEKTSEIYEVYHRLHASLSPDLFIFSQCSSLFSVFKKEIESLKYMVNKLSYLEGIFSRDELPLLYILSYVPFEHKTRLILPSDSSGVTIKEEEKSFLDTLRFYIVMRNIADVANLLGIHANSVKYRIGKILKYFGQQGESTLGEASYISLLIQLELLILEK